jgi:hypothetical protein
MIKWGTCVFIVDIVVETKFLQQSAKSLEFMIVIHRLKSEVL